jgi:hypothetical protein
VEQIHLDEARRGRVEELLAGLVAAWLPVGPVACKEGGQVEVQKNKQEQGPMAVGSLQPLDRGRQEVS